MLESALLGVSVAVDDNAVVSLVDEVRAAADVIQVGRLAAPALQLAGVRHKPDVHVIVLGEALDLGQHLAHILCLCHVQRPLMVQLIVRIDDQAPDAVPAKVAKNMRDQSTADVHESNPIAYYLCSAQYSRPLKMGSVTYDLQLRTLAPSQYPCRVTCSLLLRAWV